jgi:D-alanyl-D-alanine carboxypeptidase/D-alanyl-D-alanine-endopeptidase (penicillin-binding protein 4)
MQMRSLIKHTKIVIRTSQFVQVLCIILTLYSCSAEQKIAKKVKNDVLNAAVLQNAHVGIHIYNATDNKILFDHQGNKYFIPASNTKILTCYATMKHLGDSLPGIQYFSNDTALFIIPTGDPTLLHRDFSFQPVIDLLKSTEKKIYIDISHWKEEALGFGWAWDDYNDDYMAERSMLPVYGNIVEWTQLKQKKENPLSPADTVDTYFISNPDISWKVKFNTNPGQNNFFVKRHRTENSFTITEGNEAKASIDIPLFTEDIQTILNILKDSTHKDILITELPTSQRQLQTIFSQPTDSLLKIMMHRSDNFFAEQLLLMVSYQMLNYMNDAAVIDSILRSDLKEIPQKPKWVDGSGLSRYNLFTPQDLVFVLRNIKDAFGMNRIKAIFPTAGSGTLRNYFKDLRGQLFAKTGTLSNQVTLSGFIITKKNKVFIFSILVNAHNSSVSAIRKTIEPLIGYLYSHY